MSPDVSWPSVCLPSVGPCSSLLPLGKPWGNSKIGERDGGGAATTHGTRCRGMGTNRKSCGQEKRKLNICGMKKSSSVLLK